MNSKLIEVCNQINQLSIEIQAKSIVRQEQDKQILSNLKANRLELLRLLNDNQSRKP